MSTHEVKVVPIELLPHPNADQLSIVKVAGYTVVVRTDDWKGVDRGVYVEPDYVVPQGHPQFEFLGQHTKLITNNGVTGYRVKTKRFRGVRSFGLLVPAPEGANIGDDVADLWGIARYEPPIPTGTNGEVGKPPKGVIPVYDVESGYKFHQTFIPGELIVATEKVHGCNARFCCRQDEMFCGSRNEWKRPDAGTLWWSIVAKFPQITELCRARQDCVLYGEVYGHVQDLRYGHGKGEASFVAFDIICQGEYIERDLLFDICQEFSIQTVPVVYEGPFISHEHLMELSTGKSIVASWRNADQLREGIVVKAVPERTSEHLGRAQVKYVSPEFLSRD